MTLVFQTLSMTPSESPAANVLRPVEANQDCEVTRK